MKKTLAIAIVLASIATYAQTETTTTSTPAPAVKSKVKKAKKKHKAGASNETIVKPVAAVTDKEAGTPTTVASEVADAGKTISPEKAAGTSAVAVSDVAPTKKWAGFVNVYSTDDAADTKNLQTLTSIGGSYKIADKLTLKVGETFETLTAGEGDADSIEKRDMIKKSNFRPAYLDVNIGTSLPGMFGSKDQPASLTYRAMGSDSVYTTIGGYAGIVGMYEANLSTPYQISPKLDVNVQSQVRHVVPKGDQAAESNRILVIPYLNYAINDTFTVYQAAGPIMSLRDNMDLRRKYTRLYLETGVSITATKNLSFSFDISQDKAIQSSDDNVPVSEFALYSPRQNAPKDGKSASDRTLDAVAYEGYMSYSF